MSNFWGAFFMAKFTYEFKIHVVQYYLQNKDGLAFTSNKFQVEQSAIRKWVALYRQHGAEALQKRSYSSLNDLSLSICDSIGGRSIKLQRTLTFQPSAVFQPGKNFTITVR